MPGAKTFAYAFIVMLFGVPATQVEAHNCQCRNRGVMFDLGQTSCLHVDGTSYLALCEMKLNVSSWTKIEDGCPISRARAPGVRWLSNL